MTTLRTATVDDVERLVAWHADPEVSRFWDDETFTPAEMSERLARPDVEAWIVRATASRSDTGWSRVTVDPYTWNEQALRAWRIAGFVPVSHHDADDEHTAPWVLMEFRP